MELNKMEALLEKYFEGETSIAEQNELKSYFSSSNVAPHLAQYQFLFGYFAEAKAQTFDKKIPQVSSKLKMAWFSIAASVIVLLGIAAYSNLNLNTVKETKELGTFENPEEALKATQKALAMLSNQVNVGIEGVQYVEIYEVTKYKVFVE